MSGEIEAAGELATGALLGRAMEPSAGEGHGDSHGLCLNCGTALVGSHCHNCGQAGHVHRSLSAIGHDILHGVFHFEGKLWRTLPMLAWRPGELTRRYIDGERARFVSPMAIFLFSVFAMFAVFSWTGISTPTDLDIGSLKPVAAIDAAKKNTQRKLEKAQTKLARAEDDSEREEYRERIADAQSDLAGLDKAAKFGAYHARAITGLSALVASQPLEAWKDWLVFHQINSHTDVLPSALDDAHFAFYGTTLSGTPQQRSRDKRALDALKVSDRSSDVARFVAAEASLQPDDYGDGDGVEELRGFDA